MDTMTEMNTTTIDAPSVADATEIADASQTTAVKPPPTGHRERSSEHRIDLEPAYRVDDKGRAAGHGKAVMVYQGEVIGESHQPAFDAARYLLAHGLALPSDRLTTFREGRPCVYTSVGRAAKLAIAENGKSGPRIVAYREPPVEALRAMRDKPKV